LRKKTHATPEKKIKSRPPQSTIQHITIILHPSSHHKKKEMTDAFLASIRPPIVINLKDYESKGLQLTNGGNDSPHPDGNIIYCGQRLESNLWSLDHSNMWFNPFLKQGKRKSVVCQCETDEDVRMYRAWIHTTRDGPVRWKEIWKFTGKQLACWCAPGPCHCDVLVQMWRLWFDQWQQQVRDVFGQLQLQNGMSLTEGEQQQQEKFMLEKVVITEPTLELLQQAGYSVHHRFPDAFAFGTFQDYIRKPEPCDALVRRRL
jgi:hypothetical protein